MTGGDHALGKYAHVPVIGNSNNQVRGKEMPETQKAGAMILLEKDQDTRPSSNS